MEGVSRHPESLTRPPGAAAPGPPPPARRPGILPARLRAHLLCRVEGIADRFAISFDDGPSPRNTPRVLELLARHGARATFFQLGARVRRHPRLARRVIEEGHEIGLHGDRHLPPALSPAFLFRREFDAGRRAVRDAAGVIPRLYRPPFGLMTPSQARRVREWGCVPVLGDVYPRDPDRPGADRLVARAMAAIAGGSILILHDSGGLGDADRSQTIEAADVILAEQARRGRRAVAVGDLLAGAGRPHR